MIYIHSLSILINYLFAFSLSAVFTPLMIKAAYKTGMVARPGHDRWHKKETALLGGLAIYVSFILTSLVYVPIDQQDIFFLFAASFIFAIGLVDDLYALSPGPKLLGQFLAAVLVVGDGTCFSAALDSRVEQLITVIWILGITNAFNLLDNMDGLSAGTAIVVGWCLFFNSIGLGNNNVALLPIFTGACTGFLIYNFNPAKIFMGDCGSLFLGFSLAVMAIQATELQHSGAGLFWGLILMVTYLVVPIMDTTMVSILRILNGRPVYQGGRDHISHRLVAIGLTERQAVIVLYMVSVLSGVTGLGLDYFNQATAIMLYLVMIAGLVVFFIWIARVPVYGSGEVAAGYDQVPGQSNQNGSV